MTGYHKPLALIAAVLGLTAWTTGVQDISAPELAKRIMRGDAALRVIDLRSSADFAQFHIPGARQETPGDLASESFPRGAAIVLYSDGRTDSLQAPMLLRARGYHNVRYLRGGIGEWISRVFDPRLPADATPAERAAFERAANMSRFFGGIPKADVPRTEIPASSGSTKATVAAIRRRGC